MSILICTLQISHKTINPTVRFYMGKMNHNKLRGVDGRGHFQTISISSRKRFLSNFKAKLCGIFLLYVTVYSSKSYLKIEGRSDGYLISLLKNCIESHE